MSALDRIHRFVSIGAGAAGWVLVALIRAYQAGLRPHNPWGCKFHPSCSSYAIEAVRLHGPWRGAWLAAGRLLRCRPGTFGGIDPVPEPEELSASAPVAEALRLRFPWLRSGRAGHATGLDSLERVESVSQSSAHRLLPVGSAQQNTGEPAA